MIKSLTTVLKHTETQKQNFSVIKLLFSFILIFFLFFNTNQAYAANASGTDGACKWTWTESSKTLTVTGGNMTSRTSYSAYPWANYVNQATKIVVDTNTIGDSAFSQCRVVQTIDLGANVSSVGDKAFYSAGNSSYYSGNVTLYLRRNGNMTFGSNPFYNFSSNDIVHLYPSNANGMGTAPYDGATPDYKFDFGSTSSWYSWDGIEWNFTGTTTGTLNIRKRSNGDGSMDATTDKTAYPWYNLLRDGRVTSINVQSGTHIGQNAFYECDDVTSITVNISGNINTRAFYQCYKATSIKVNCSRIESYAFQGCRVVQTIDLGSNVSYVGDRAFYYAGNSTYYSGNVTLYLRRNGNMTFGSNPFYNFRSNDIVHLYQINSNGANPSIYNGYSPSFLYDLGVSWYSWDGIEWSFNNGILNVRTRTGGDGSMDATTDKTAYPWYQILRDGQVKTINIQSGTHIGQNAFYECDDVTSITVNISGNINTRAFYQCYKATSIKVNCSRIESYAFSQCRVVQTIDLGSNVSYVGDMAFSSAGNSSYYSGNVTLYLRRNGNMTFGSNPFYNFRSNDIVHLYPSNANGMGTAPYKEYSPDYRFDLGSTSSWYSWDGIEWNFTGTTTGTLNIRKRSNGDGSMDATTDEKAYPWYNLLRDGRVTSINVQSGTHIGQRAFYNCDDVTSITVNISGNINTRAFYQCYKATSIKVNCSRIESYVFSQCRVVQTIDLGSNVSYVGDRAFSSAGSATYYSGNVTLYLRKKANMTFGSSPFYNFRSSDIIYLWKANSAGQQTTPYNGYKPKFNYFDSVGEGYGCSHSSLTSWQTSGSNHLRKCTHCAKITTQHAISWQWKNDGTYHWQACSGGCGITQGKTGHTWTTTTSQTCTSKGQKKCNTCGRIETLAELGHNPGDEWFQDVNVHWHICTRCGAQVEIESHTYNNNQCVCGRYNTVTVTFDLNKPAPEGGLIVDTSPSKIEDITYTYGDAYYDEKYGLVDPVLPDYIFLGWYTTASDNGTKIEADTKVTEPNAHTLYAHWKITELPFDEVEIIGDKAIEYTGLTEEEYKKIHEPSEDLPYGKIVLAAGSTEDFSDHYEYTWEILGDDGEWKEFNLPDSEKELNKLTINKVTRDLNNRKIRVTVRNNAGDKLTSQEITLTVYNLATGIGMDFEVTGD